MEKDPVDRPSVEEFVSEIQSADVLGVSQIPAIALPQPTPTGEPPSLTVLSNPNATPNPANTSGAHALGADETIAGSRDTTTSHPADESSSEPNKSSRLGWWAAALVLIAAIGIGVGLSQRDSSPTAQVESVATTATSAAAASVTGAPTTTSPLDVTEELDGGTSPTTAAASTTLRATTTAAPVTTVAPTTTAAPLPVPTNLNQFSQGNRNGRQFITINWTTPANIPTVQVQRDGQIIRDDDNDFYSDETQFNIGQTVTYRIRSVSGNQTSAWSAPLVTVFTCPDERCPPA